jgi:ornithine cyclodeaminase/alanine dehydrogenase-like protein (mu-crystallin family)
VAGAVTQDDVTTLGAVLAGDAVDRRSEEETTLFDSTGLAIQDLAVARLAFLRSGELDLPRLAL